MVSSFVDQALKRAIDNNQGALNAFLNMPDCCQHAKSAPKTAK
jgi:hypothetical protein